MLSTGLLYTYIPTRYLSRYENAKREFEIEYLKLGSMAIIDYLGGYLLRGIYLG